MKLKFITVIFQCRFPFLVFGSYLSAIPVANYLSKADGFASNYLVYPLVTALGRTNLSLSTAVNDDPRKLVVALTALYIFSVNIISGVMSVTGQLLGNKEGYRNKGLFTRYPFNIFNIVE